MVDYAPLISPPKINLGLLILHIFPIETHHLHKHYSKIIEYICAHRYTQAHLVQRIRGINGLLGAGKFWEGTTQSVYSANPLY